MKNFYGVLIFLNSFCIPCSGQTSDVEAVRLFGEGKFPVESVMERDVVNFNNEIVESTHDEEDWTEEPLLIALRYCGMEMMGNRRVIEIDAAPREFGSDRQIESAAITITNSGFLDDAVSGDRYRIHLVRNEEGIWQLSRAIWARLCSRRGSGFYSARPCP